MITLLYSCHSRVKLLSITILMIYTTHITVIAYIWWCVLGKLSLLFYSVNCRWHLFNIFVFSLFLCIKKLKKCTGFLERFLLMLHNTQILMSEDLKKSVLGGNKQIFQPQHVKTFAILTSCPFLRGQMDSLTIF